MAGPVPSQVLYISLVVARMATVTKVALCTVRVVIFAKQIVWLFGGVISFF